MADRPVCGDCQTYLDAPGVGPGRVAGLCGDCSPVDPLHIAIPGTYRTLCGKPTGDGVRTVDDITWQVSCTHCFLANRAR